MDYGLVQGLTQPSSSLQHSLRQQANSGSRLTLLPGSHSHRALQTSGLNCTLAGLIAEGGDMRDGNCSTTASPRHMGQHSNSSSMTLMNPSSSNFSTPPFASPASSEGGAPSVRLSGNPFVQGISGGFSLPGHLDVHERDSEIKSENLAAAYFSAETLDARDYESMGRAAVGDFGRPQLDSRNNYCGQSSISNMNNLLFNIQQQQQQQEQQQQQPQQHQQQILNRFAQGMGSPLPSLMMLSPGHPFLQEQRASNENTPLGSPQPHGGGLGGDLWKDYDLWIFYLHRGTCNSSRHPLFFFLGWEWGDEIISISPKSSGM